MGKPFASLVKALCKVIYVSVLRLPSMGTPSLGIPGLGIPSLGTPGKSYASIVQAWRPLIGILVTVYK